MHTFTRSEGPRGGWEEDNNQKAGLFSDSGSHVDKVEGETEDEDQGSSEKSSEKSRDSDGLKAAISSKKAFAIAINDKTMPPAIKRLSIFA